MSDQLLSIIMPAYNAASHIEGVLSRIPDGVWEMVRTLWIVNDGSTDETAATAERIARFNDKIKVAHQPTNGGYGSAVKRGLALCREEGPEMVVCLHADGQYPPEEIPRFAAAMREGEYDILQGSRMAAGTALQGGMPFYKFIAGQALTFFENRVFGLRLTDFHSGYMWYSRKALQKLPFEHLSSSFDFDVEVIVSAHQSGMKVGELPIPTRYAGEVSRLNPIGYGLRIVGVMGKSLVGRYRP